MKQQGFVLIVVIVLLLVISILGAIALKRSTTDLQIATAAQIDKLTFQANNIAFAKLEEENRTDIAAGRVGRIDTLLGYMARPGQHYVNAEVVLCLRKDTDKLFRLDRISEKNATGGILKNRGFCDATKQDQFVSEGRIITQMTFRKTAEGDHQAFGGEAIGTSSNDLSSSEGANSLCSYFDAHAVSLLPGYTSSSNAQINVCLKKTIGEIGTCLTELGVPHNIQVQTYRGQAAGIQCIG